MRRCTAQLQEILLFLVGIEPTIFSYYLSGETSSDLPLDFQQPYLSSSDFRIRGKIE